MSEKEPMVLEQKEDMPQMSESGLSWDFLNEVGSLPNYIELYERGKITAEETLKFLQEKIVETKKGTLVKTYEQRFPDSQFKDVITDTNRAKVEELNTLVKLCNSTYRTFYSDTMLSNEDKIKIVKEQIIPVFHDIERLIKGKT